MASDPINSNSIGCASNYGCHQKGPWRVRFILSFSLEYFFLWGACFFKSIFLLVAVSLVGILAAKCGCIQQCYYSSSLS